MAMMKQTSHAYKIPLKHICLADQGEDGRTALQCENMSWMTLARECDQWCAMVPVVLNVQFLLPQLYCNGSIQ